MVFVILYFFAALAPHTQQHYTLRLFGGLLLLVPRRASDPIVLGADVELRGLFQPAYT